MYRTIPAMVLFLTLAVALCACGDDDGNGGSTGSNLDLTRGVKCVTAGSPNMTYHFKNGMMRQESSFQIPGTTSYDLQPSNDVYYKVVLKGTDCGAIKIKPVMTTQQWQEKVIDTAAKLKGTPGANQPGAPSCEQADLPDSKFWLPAGCKVSG